MALSCPVGVSNRSPSSGGAASSLSCAAAHPPAQLSDRKLTSLINGLIGSVILCILEPHPRLHDGNVSVVLWQLSAHSRMAVTQLPSLESLPLTSSPVNLPALGTVLWNPLLRLAQVGVLSHPSALLNWPAWLMAVPCHMILLL